MRNTIYFRMKHLLALPLLFLLFMAMSTIGTAQTVTSDLPDYAPGTTATITGSGFAAGEDILIHVDHFFDFYGHEDEDYTIVAADNLDGSFVFYYEVGLDESFDEFVLTASQASGSKASVYFTDAPTPTFTFNLDVVGIPVGVTVAVSGTKPNGNTFTGSTVVNGTGNDGKDNVLAGTSYSFSFPSTVTNTAVTPNVTYNLISVDKSSPQIGGVTGVNGGELTITATYELACTTPTISTHPANATKTYGESVTFSVTAAGTAPLSYQWKKGGADIIGATNSTYTISSLAMTDAGSYTVYVSNACGNVTSNAATLVVNKATATLSLSNLTATYDGTSKSATVTTNPVGLTGVTVTYDGSTTAPTNAGTYAVVASLNNTNYQASNATGSLVISQADATVNVSGYTGVYDALAHGASGTATGINGVDLSAGLSLGATFTDVPGGNANWKFEGGTNYKDQSGTVAIVISQADATVNVSGYTGVYDALAHGASGTATGINGVDLSAGLDLGATFTDVPGGEANWTFEGGTNYKDQSGTVAIVISQADATVNVSGYEGVYDATAHGASGTATGINGVDLSAGLDLGATFTDVPGGIASWKFEGGTNYKDQSGTVAIVISKASLSVVVDNKDKYCGQVNPIFSGHLEGLKGTDAITISTITTTATVNSCPDPYPITATLSDPDGRLNNYNVYNPGATLTVKAVSIVAANITNNPILVTTGTTTLSATISPSISGVNVVFNLDDGNGGSLISYSGLTDNGVVTIPNITISKVEVFKVTAIIGSNCIKSDELFLAVYDPSGGFVTGGGWIMSPVKTDAQFMQVEGKANFGFVSKYKKGSQTPEGNTEFQFHAGNLNFSSSSYNAGSLVIAGAQAIYKGEGTINGTSGYSFMVSAIDGQVNGTGADKFRIKIWKTGTTTIVYDNQFGEAENANASTVIGGGSIMIQPAAKNKSAQIFPDASTSAFESSLKVYPNPFTDKLNIEFSYATDTKAKLEIYSITGAKLQTLYDGPVTGGQLYNFEYLPRLVSSQVVFYHLTLDGKTQVGKILYNERR